MVNINNLPIETGNYVDGENNVENIVDILNDSSQALFPDKHNTLNTQPAKSGNMVGSDGNVYNIVDLLKNVAGLEDKIIVKSATIPEAGEEYDGAVYQYVGTTNATYTHGYIYECIGSQSTLARAVYTPAYFVCDEDRGSLANFFAQATEDYLQIKSGRFKYLQAGDIWNINGLDENGDTIFEDYQLYTQDLIDAGFTFIVPMEDIADGAEVSYELTYFEQTSYAWTRIDVQPHAEIGRYLSSWNCATGLAATNPPESPYIYKTGDYFIVGTIDEGGTNYKPSGTQYVSGTASTTVESKIVNVNDTYLFDGTNWTLLKTSSTVTSVNGQTGAVNTIDDNSTTSLTTTWSANKLNSTIGDIENVLETV